MRTVGVLDGWTWEELKPVWHHHLPGLDQPEVGFVRQGNFTICEVYAASDLRAFGIAKRAASFDRNKPKIARQIAFGRACKALAQELRRGADSGTETQPATFHEQRAADMEAIIRANRLADERTAAVLLERDKTA